MLYKGMIDLTKEFYCAIPGESISKWKDAKVQASLGNWRNSRRDVCLNGWEGARERITCQVLFNKLPKK